MGWIKVLVYTVAIPQTLSRTDDDDDRIIMLARS